MTLSELICLYEMIGKPTPRLLRRAKERQERGARTVNRFGDRVEVIVQEQPVSEAVDAYLALINHPTEAAQ